MTTVGTADVALVQENADGSAVYQFNFPPEAMEALTRLGILTAIQAGIGEAKKLAPEHDPQFTDEIKALADDAGFVFWNEESWWKTNSVIDWSCEYDDELVEFYHLVKNQTKQEIIDILQLQQKHHDESQGSHNYWTVIAKYIEENT